MQPIKISMKSNFYRSFSCILILFLSFYSFSQVDSTRKKNTDSIPNLKNTLNPGSFSTNQIQILPFRSVNGLAIIYPSTYNLKYEKLVVDGFQSGSDYTFVEGMQIADGNEFPFQAISIYNLIRSNQPIYCGNVAGSMIEIETPVYHEQFHLNLDGFTNLDNKDGAAFNSSTIELNMGGPLRFGKKENKSKLTPVFYLASNYTFTNDPYPSWEKKYQATSETMDFLTENPLRPTGLASGGTYLNADFVDESDFTEVNYHQNANRNKSNNFLKLAFPINSNMNLSMGSYAKIDKGREFMFKNALFNSHNNPETYFRNFDNYLKFDHNIHVNENLSINYVVHFQYSNYYFRRWDENHKDRYFEYGYLGKYKTYKTPTYELGDIEIDGQLYENVWLLNSWDYDTAYTFQNLGFNPELARYTEQVYELYPESEGHWMNSDQLTQQGGFLNGQDRQMMVYGLWSGHGVNTPYASDPMMTITGVNNRAGESRKNKYRGTFYADFNFKNHKITAGLEYTQKVERYYFIDAHKLWNTMRDMTNFHLLELDLNNPIAVYDNGIFQDTIIFYRNYDGSSQFDFDERLRQELGFEVDGLEYILIDSYDMRNNTIDYYDQDGRIHTKQLSSELLSLNLFSPLEIVNSYWLVQNMGYDVYGNKLSGKTNPYEYFYNGQSDAFRPIYNAFYLMDEFRWKFLDVSAGLRIDRYDANQPVLKDKHCLYEINTAGQISSIDGNPVNHPDNIQDYYKVYVDNINNPTVITGYRSGDMYYDKNGNEINAESSLPPGTEFLPYLVYPDVEIGDPEWNPEMSFTDYKPVVNLLPQINVNLTSDYGHIYFNYNSFTQTPKQYHRFKPEKYLFNGWSIFALENPSLKPIRTDKIIVGIRPKIYKGLYADFSFMWTNLKNANFIESVSSYPQYYLVISNRDEAVKNQGIIASLNYQSSGYSGLSGSVSFTRYFIKEEDLMFQNTANLVINSFVSYDFGYGRDFVLKGSKTLRSVFELFNIGIYYQFRSGLYIPAITSIYPGYNYDNFSYYYTPDISTFNLRIEKGFYIKPIKLKASLYFWAENLFNQKNLYFIRPYAGGPDENGNWSISCEDDEAVNPESYEILCRYRLNVPDYYAKPRIFRMGLIIKL